jgi:SNF2 family DNA or RNA helicase
MSLKVENTSKKLLTYSDLSEPQQLTIDHLFNCDATFLIAKMGAGKTVCTLTAIDELLKSGVITRALIIAPLKVCDSVWRHEHKKWDHLKHLIVNVATGDPLQRESMVDIPSDILVINKENVQWLFTQYKDQHECNGLVVDELSQYRDPGGRTLTKMRRRMKDFVWRVGMTGTPVSEDFCGLYSQMLIIDQGQSLGTNNQQYLDLYFFPTDYERRNWQLRPGSGKLITEKIRPYIHTMPDYRGELPPITYKTEVVELPRAARVVYEKLKKDLLLEIEAGTVLASNEAVLSGKLRQLASGFVYTSEEEVQAQRIHAKKSQRLRELIEGADGPVVVVYWYTHDRDMLKSLLNAPSLSQEKNKERAKLLEDNWNAGDIPVLLLHPRSGGHGLNLAQGGHDIIWYGPEWSRDLFEQVNARLWRKGQEYPVTVYTIEARNTVDQVISARVEGKGKFDKLLHMHLSS